MKRYENLKIVLVLTQDFIISLHDKKTGQCQ
jgi:hypothetical protein